MHELVLRAPEDAVESVSDALMELEALSVSVEDADADTPAEQALFGEPDMPAPAPGWQRSTLRALFDDEAAATAAATWLLAQDEAEGVALQGLAAVAEQDWVRLTQSQFAPVEITPSFWIVPSWHEAPAAAAQVIRLDPGLAFGTGTHPTTRMCLRWIARHAADLRGAPVLDYGCGSGILALAALALGAKRAVAVDIDPQALSATRENAARNDLGRRLDVMPAAALGADEAGFDVVLANILSGPLVELAPRLARLSRADGRIVLAGLLDEQAAGVAQAYRPWFDVGTHASRDGWTLLVGRRRGG